jgi:hypothetical protein
MITLFRLLLFIKIKYSFPQEIRCSQKDQSVIRPCSFTQEIEDA